MSNMKAEWEKLGGGVLKFRGKKIRKGDHFIAYEDEIPMGFRDVIKLIGPVKKNHAKITDDVVTKIAVNDTTDVLPKEEAPKEEAAPKKITREEVEEVAEIEQALAEAESEVPVRRNPVKVPKYKLEKNGGWYNIINTATNKKMNTSALRKDDADAFLARML